MFLIYKTMNIGILFLNKITIQYISVFVHILVYNLKPTENKNVLVKL